MIGKLVNQQLNQLSNSREITETKEAYDHVILTEEEIAHAVAIAKKEKHFRLKNEEWNEKIKATPTWFTPDPDQYFELLGKTKSKNGLKFEIADNEHLDVVKSLCAYFAGADSPLDPKKGILLMGKPGCGKTHLMTFFAKNPKASYSTPTCKNIVDKFANGWTYDNQGTIEAFSTLKKAEFDHKWNQKHLGYCFGDFGAEISESINFGNRRNVMEEIVFNRYENSIPFIMTHFTTNLNSEELKVKYGWRMIDRLNEMCNIVVLRNDSFRK